MKKSCFILSIAGHALAILLFLNADFPIKMFYRPLRVIDIEISAPAPLFIATGSRARPAGIAQAQVAAQMGGGIDLAGSRESAGAETSEKGSRGLSFPAPAKFRLQRATPGTFTLLQETRSPLPAFGFKVPGGTPRLGNYSAAAYNPGVPMGGNAVPGGVTVVPFDIKEKTIAAWTEAVLARIERNWIISPLARLAFSGQVKVTLTIEKDGRERALVMDESSLPESLARSALQAVRASLPLPPLPENVAGQTFAFAFVFVYNG